MSGIYNEYIINRDKKRNIYGFGKIKTEWENIYKVGKYIRSGKIYLNQIFEFPRRPYCYLVKYRYSQYI
jgi:hypothetical protein